MQTSLNISQKITTDTRYENEANRTGLPFYHFFANRYAINKLSDSKHKNTLKLY